jgi:MoaA/NifB/PqqE/SkfB family radical SAM enzyme
MLKKKRANFIKQYLTSKIRVAEFGITNCCSTKCTFCGIWKQKQKVIIDKETGIKAIDKLAELGVAHITLTGGDPLFNPHVFDFVKYCTKKHIHSLVLNADARLLTEETIIKLKDAQADFLCISVDSHDPAVVDRSRGIPGLLGHIEKGVALAKKHGLRTTASILIWKESHDKLEQLFDKLNSIGFDHISVNYPEISKSTVYPLGGESVELSPKEISVALAEVIRLKKTGKYDILNNITSMKNIMNFLDHPDKAEYHCYGGSKVLFIDWFLNIYPCMHLPNPLGSLWELQNEDLKMIKCNQCNMSWYRDFSVYFHGLKSLKPLYESMGLFNHLSKVKKGVSSKT